MLIEEEVLQEIIELNKNKILDLTNDKAFKRVFQDEKFKWYLSFIISFCTKMNQDYIYNHIVYKNNFISSDDLSKKTGEADILVEIDNKIINLEMNKEVTPSLIKKNKYYVNALDSRNTETSNDNKIINKEIIQINISTKSRIKGTNTLLYEIVQMDKNLLIEDSYNNTKIYDINLEYLEKELYNKGKLKEEEKKLLLFIEQNKEKLEKIFKGDDNMNETVEDLSFGKFIKADIDFYNSYDHEAFEKIVHEEALQQALEEGQEQGISQRNIEIAKKAIENGIDMKTISKITGLSIEEIKKLSK